MWSPIMVLRSNSKPLKSNINGSSNTFWPTSNINITNILPVYVSSKGKKLLFSADNLLHNASQARQLSAAGSQHSHPNPSSKRANWSWNHTGLIPARLTYCLCGFLTMGLLSQSWGHCKIKHGQSWMRCFDPHYWTEAPLNLSYVVMCRSFTHVRKWNSKNLVWLMWYFNNILIVN